MAPPRKKPAPRRGRVTRKGAAPSPEIPETEAAETEPEAERLEGDEMLDAIVASLGERGMPLSSDGLSIHLPGVIPTGSEWLDLALGRGGWPLGRVSMVSGDEGSGKTTLALQACANTQRMGGIAVYVDAEYKLDRDYAKAVGVDDRRLLIVQPNSMEQAIEVITDLSETFSGHRASRRVPMFFVFDSLNAFLTEQELAGQTNTPGTQARAMSQGLRTLVPAISRHRVALLMISQIRQKIGVTYGSTKSTSGGKAPLFYSTIVANLAVKQRIKKGDKKIGNLVGVEIGKNQVAPPFTRCLLSVRYGEGIDYADSLHHAAIAAGIVDAGKKAVDDDEKPVRRFGKKKPADDDEIEDVEEEEIKAPKGGSGWVTFTPPDGGEPIRWQGPGGLRNLDVETLRVVRAKVRERYGWGD
jgi:recombination protein RecA